MAVYPTGIVGFAQAQLHKTNNLGISTVSGDITSGSVTINIANAATKTNWPAANFAVRVDDELVFVTTRAGNVLQNCVRGFGGTIAAAHLDAAAIRVVAASDFLQVLADEVVAIETALGTNPAASPWARLTAGGARTHLVNLGDQVLIGTSTAQGTAHRLWVETAGDCAVTARDTADGTQAAMRANSTGIHVGAESAHELFLRTNAVDRITIAAGGTFMSLLAGMEQRYFDADGSNYVGFKAPALTGNLIWTLPTGDGGGGQVLKTNGAGALSWVSLPADAQTYASLDILNNPVANTILFQGPADLLLSNSGERLIGGVGISDGNGTVRMVSLGFPLGVGSATTMHVGIGAFKFLRYFVKGRFMADTANKTNSIYEKGGVGLVVSDGSATFGTTVQNTFGRTDETVRDDLGTIAAIIDASQNIQTYNCDEAGDASYTDSGFNANDSFGFEISIVVPGTATNFNSAGVLVTIKIQDDGGTLRTVVNSVVPAATFSNGHFVFLGNLRGRIVNCWAKVELQ